jgi:hypothetical protein
MSEADSTAASPTLDYPDAELVFAVVCAVGTDYRPVVDYLKNLLRRARYTPQELHVSDFFPEIGQKLGIELKAPRDNEYQRIDAGMRSGNAIREKTEDPGFLALDAASRIFSARPGADGDDPEALPHTAHIIVSLKREEEVETLRKIASWGKRGITVVDKAASQLSINKMDAEASLRWEGHRPCLRWSTAVPSGGRRRIGLRSCVKGDQPVRACFEPWCGWPLSAATG